LESKRIFFKSIIDRNINDLVRYPFGTISKSFYSVFPFGLFMYFAPPPVFLSFRSLRSLSFICIKREGEEKTKTNLTAKLLWDSNLQPRMVASLVNHYTNMTYKKNKNKNILYTNGIYDLTKDNRYYLQHIGF
jgi:hypothetical protein